MSVADSPIISALFRPQGDDKAGFAVRFGGAFFVVADGLLLVGGGLLSFILPPNGSLLAVWANDEVVTNRIAKASNE